MDAKRAIAVVLVVALVVGAVPALAAIANHSAPADGEVPVTTDETPTIILDGAEYEVDLVDLWEDDELNISTDEGAIRVSGDDGAEATLHVDDIEGDETVISDISAGSNWIELDPADKNRVDVRGDVDMLAFGDIGVDDGNTDLQLVGPEDGLAELRLYDLDPDAEYGLYDPDIDRYLSYVETDAEGHSTAAVDLPHGTHSLEVHDVDNVDGPTLSDLEPENQVTELPESLSVAVEADAYPAEVDFYLEGEHVETVETTSDGRVSTDIDIDDLGAYEWSATVTDAVEQTETVETSFETPQELTIREEHDPTTVIDDTDVTVRFFTTDGDIVIREETDDGTLDMEGLPNTDFVVVLESEEHYDRRVYLGDIFEQQDLFMLNRMEFPRDENEVVSSRFVYEDLTGQFPREETTIQVQRAIDIDGDNESEFKTVAGDFWGAGGEFETTLQRGERYNIVLINQETGVKDNVGTHIPTEDLEHEIRTSGLVQEALNESGIYANAQLNESDGVIEYVYSDPSEETESLSVVVKSQTGEEILLDETVPGPLGTHSNTVELNETELEQNWVVEFDSDRHRSAIPLGAGSVDLPVSVPGWLLTLLMSMAVTFVGALYGPRTALLGAWAMVFVAAGVSMFGWAFSPASVLVAALVAVAATLISRQVY